MIEVLGTFFFGFIGGVLCGALLATPKFKWSTGIDDRLQRAEGVHPMDSVREVWVAYENRVAFNDGAYFDADWYPITAGDLLVSLMRFKGKLQSSRAVIVKP